MTSDRDARLRLLEEHVRAEVDHDLEAIMRTWGEEPWFDDVAWEEKSYGREAVRGHYAELLKAFPDLDIEVHEHHVTEHGAIAETTVSGTHTGPWRDLPPTGRRMSSRVCAFYTFDDAGLLQLERTYYDKAIVLEQLGLFQDPRRPLGRVMAAITPPFTVLRAFLGRLFRR